MCVCVCVCVCVCMCVCEIVCERVCVMGGEYIVIMVLITNIPMAINSSKVSRKIS